MTKAQLAQALAEALNILNGLQSDLDVKNQGYIHNLFAKIPPRVLDDADFANNGEVNAAQLVR